MFVCVDDGGAPRVVGWTSVETRERVIELPEPLPMPARWGHGGLTESATITVHRYETRTANRAADGRQDRVIILQEGDDPTHLPDYRPVAEGVSTVVARSRRMGADFAMRQASEAEFRHSRVPGVRGLPMIWTSDGYGGIEVFPEPLDDYEIIRTEARTMLFHNPLMTATMAPVNFISTPRGPSIWQEMFENHRRQMMEVTANAAAFQIYLARRSADAMAVTEIRDGCIVGVTITNPGAGYTTFPEFWFGRRSSVDPETAQRSRERARGLLKSLLTPKQWTEFEAFRTVTERIGDSVFKLRPGDMIEARKSRLIGSVKERWCVNPDPWADGNDFMPEEDKLIGQLLHLRAGPDKLRAQANVFKG